MKLGNGLFLSLGEGMGTIEYDKMGVEYSNGASCGSKGVTHPLSPRNLEGLNFI